MGLAIRQARSLSHFDRLEACPTLELSKLFDESFATCRSALHDGLHESSEQWMSLGWFGMKLRVELYSHKPGVFRYFDNFYQFTVWTGSGEFETMGGKLVPIGIIKFVAVAVTFVNGFDPVMLSSFGALP